MAQYHPKLRAEVKLIDGRGTLLVNGQPLAPMGYTSCFRADAGLAQRLTDADLQLYFLWTDSGWTAPEQWQQVAEEARALLAANPDVYLIMRVGFYPSEEWMDANPDELETFEDGRTDHIADAHSGYGTTKRMVCLSSRVFAEEASRYMDGLIEFVDNSDFGHRVIGYFLLAGATGEWNYPNEVEGGDSKHVYGFSPAFKRFYSDWLRAKYFTEEALKAAWRDETASFDDPKIPNKQEQRLTKYQYPEAGEGRCPLKSDWGHFLDPQKSRMVTDFYEARTAGTAASIEHIARHIKQRTEGRCIVGSFWGGLSLNQFQTSGTGGTLMLAKSPYIDYFGTPSNYNDRLPGGGATFRSPVDSLAYRGKIWMNESDTRTHRARYDDLVAYGGTYTLEESLSSLKRDFAQVLCDDVHAFWFDQGQGETSYYDDPQILQLLKQQQQLAKEHYAGGRSKASEIAVVYDQDSLWHTDSDVLRDLLWLNRDLNLPRIGAPCDFIFHEDFELETLPQYKLYIFINCFNLDNADRQRIAATIRNNNKVAVWVYASGLVNPDADTQMSLENMRELTGIAMGAEDAERDGTFKITDTIHEVTQKLSPYLLYGRYQRPIMNTFGWKRGQIQMLYPTLNFPLFYVDDDEATSLGQFISNDQTAFAIKDFGDWKSIYIGAKSMNPPILRSIARLAGVHIYLDTDDIVYANRRFLTIHATIEDTKRITLPRVYEAITDAYSNEVVATNADAFELTMKNGETRMLRLG